MILPELRSRDIARRRLANQRLIGAPFATPAGVVRRLGAVQSQDYTGGKWGVAQRTPGATDADVERALTDGAIVRTVSVPQRLGQLTGTAATNAAHLPPNYDEYFIGLKDRIAIGELVKTSAVEVPADTFLAHVVAVDGQLVGGWKRTVTARAVSLRVHLVVEITGKQVRSIEAQARRYGEFLEMPMELAVETKRSSPGG